MSKPDTDKPVIVIHAASAVQLAQLHTWLGHDYILNTAEGLPVGSKQPASLAIHFTSENRAGKTIPVISFSSVAANGKSYSLPESQLSHTALSIILNLLLASREEENRNKNYAAIFERSHDIILLADCDHNIIQANEAAIRILGYKPEAFYRMNLADLFYHEDAGKDFIRNICIENKIVHWEYRLKTKTGKPVEVMMSADMMDKSEHVFLCIAQDISQQKEEYKIRKQEEHLVIMGKMAQMIAHEVRNPLNNILLAVSQLKSEAETEEAQKKTFLDIIDRNCLRINDLITEMLEPSRILDIDLHPVSLTHLMKEAIYLSEDRMILRNIIIHEHFEQDYTLLLDKEKMLIGLSNILVNAMESIEHRKGEITISSVKDAHGINIFVEDNGKGMSANEQQNIFNPYFTTKPRGTGMGMAATLQIIKAHRGRIEIISAEGQGTQIKIFLPIISGNHPE